MRQDMEKVDANMRETNDKMDAGLQQVATTATSNTAATTQAIATSQNTLEYTMPRDREAAKTPHAELLRTIRDAMHDPLAQRKEAPAAPQVNPPCPGQTGQGGDKQ